MGGITITYMQYEREILIVLKEASPNGMPLRRIALNVYNITNSLFAPQDRGRVYSLVAEWLRTESQKRGGAVERCGVRGWYRLNMRSQKVRQTLMDFMAREEDEWMM